MKFSHGKPKPLIELMTSVTTIAEIVSFFVWCELWMLLFTRYYPARRFGMNMPKSRNIVQPLQIRPLSLLFFGKKSIL